MTSALRTAFTELKPLRAGTTTIRKHDGSPQSEADLLLQRLLVGLIEEFEDEPCVIAEEGVNTLIGRQRSCGTVWVIDPLDGTSQFLNRDASQFCATVAVLHEGHPVAALVYCPELGRGPSEVVISVTGPGCPALVNGSPAKLARESPSRSVVSATRGMRAAARSSDALLPGEVKLRATSLTIDMVRTALDLSGPTGLDPFRGFYRADQRAWDALAGIVIGDSAGLVAVDLNGNPLTPLPPGFLEAVEPTFPAVLLAEEGDVTDLRALFGAR
jgi:fructose-1,6-bisphosphatase/inositol monophosphatase family enzyme